MRFGCKIRIHSLHGVTNNMFVYSVYNLFLERRRFLRADRNKCWESTGTIRLRFNAKLIRWFLNRFSGTIGGMLEKKISGKVCIYQYSRNADIYNTITHH
jgi:hypothetical protein